ncbi:unnamed protein product [Prorocentrum cordatum]|uniref:MMS19 nucleotide excision repair protein n=1 Tax=Prorocentrum cordatum TaxID=2364126 RepID=A0ABN9UVL5_9DINO|nr:unnamed protein product [Polarella glacialis]
MVEKIEKELGRDQSYMMPHVLCSMVGGLPPEERPLVQPSAAGVVELSLRLLLPLCGPGFDPEHRSLLPGAAALGVAAGLVAPAAAADASGAMAALVQRALEALLELAHCSAAHPVHVSPLYCCWWALEDFATSSPAARHVFGTVMAQRQQAVQVCLERAVAALLEGEPALADREGSDASAALAHVLTCDVLWRGPRAALTVMQAYSSTGSRRAASSACCTSLVTAVRLDAAADAPPGGLRQELRAALQLASAEAPEDRSFAVALGLLGPP